MRLVDAALTLGATLRLTRFLTTDTLGEWIVDRRVRAWANRHDALVDEEVRFAEPAEQRRLLGLMPVEPEAGWRSKVAHGIECGYCVSVYLAGAVLLATVLTPRGPLATARRVVLGALTTSYVVGYVNSRVDR